MPAVTLVSRFIPLLLLSCIAVGACDGNSDPPSSPGTPPSGGSGTQVRGTERIAWAQEGSGVINYSFIALVDEAGAPLPDARCTASGSSFECSAALPPMSAGRQRFQIVAISGEGLQSPPSQPLVLNVVPRLTT